MQIRKVRQMVEENIHLAKARKEPELLRFFGEDIAGQIAEYAKLSNVSKSFLEERITRFYLDRQREHWRIMWLSMLLNWIFTSFRI